AHAQVTGADPQLPVAQELPEAVLRRADDEAVASEVLERGLEARTAGKDPVLPPARVRVVLLTQVAGSLRQSLLPAGCTVELAAEWQWQVQVRTVPPSGLTVESDLSLDRRVVGVVVDVPGQPEDRRPGHRGIGVGGHPDRRVRPLDRQDPDSGALQPVVPA